MDQEVYIIYCLFLLFLTSCSKKESAVKVDEVLLNKFPNSVKSIIQDSNPDVVTINYLTNNAEAYATSIDTQRNDFL